MSDQQPTAAQILAALSEPFEEAEVKSKPAVVSGNRALAMFFVDARVVQDRLDDVLGVDGWQDDYECREDGNVICRLRVRIGAEWIQKVDVGGQSEQTDGGDRLKAAFSDALKRAAVKFGVARYLYRVPSQWVDYDPQKRAFTRVPTIPSAAVARATAGRPGEAPKDPAPAQPPAPVSQPAPAAAPARAKKAKGPPRNGEEFYQAVIDAEKLWIKQGHKVAGQVLRELDAWAEGQRPPYPQMPQNWNAEQIAAGVEWLRGEQGKISARKQQGAA